MARRQRQLDELARLCRAGAVDRAIDLAFGHFAEFGADGAVLELLTGALADREVPERVRRSFTELCAMS